MQIVPNQIKNSILHGVQRYPALFGILFYLQGFFSIHSTWILIFCIISFSLFFVFGKWKFWWIYLLFYLGLFQSEQQNLKESFWRNTLNSEAYMQAQFEWDEDVYLSLNQEQLKGWAWITPIFNEKLQPPLKTRKWIYAQSLSKYNLAHMTKGASWNGYIALDGNPYKKSYQTIIKTIPHHSNFIYHWRARFIQFLEKKWSHETSSSIHLIRSLTTGNRRGLPEDIYGSFGRLGLMPLLALSGMHVGIIFFIMKSFLKLIPLPKLFKDLAILNIIAFYTILGGGHHALFRASTMCAVYLLSFYLGRRYQILNVLSCIALLEIVIQPNSLYHLSFQLSYLGVLGIIWILFIKKSVRQQKQIIRKSTYIQKLFSAYLISWGAILFTWPVASYNFETIPTWSWIFSPLIFMSFGLVAFICYLGFFSSILLDHIPHLILQCIDVFFITISRLSEHMAWIQAWDDLQPDWLISYYIGLTGIVVILYQQRLVKKSV